MAQRCEPVGSGMIPAIASALDAIVGSVTSLVSARGAGRAYELYIMTGIAEGLASAGCAVRVQRSDGTAILPHDADRRFYQRGGAPTGVSGASQGPHHASSFVFRTPGSARQWEIWNGIQFVGRSAGSHEIDISIVPRAVGVALRGMPGGGLPIGRPSVAIECKDVSDPGSGDEMRAFVARLYDLTILRSHTKVQHLPKPLRAISPSSGPGTEAHETFWTGNRETFNVIARRTGFAKGAAAMTAYYAIQPHGPVAPGTAADTALTDAIVGWIMANLA